MTEFVRVKDPTTRAEITLSVEHAAHLGLEPLDKPAVDVYGRPLPAKPSRTATRQVPGDPAPDQPVEKPAATRSTDLPKEG